jgi:hypothetical protein
VKRYIVIAATALVAGCGGEDRLTRAETADRLNGGVQEVNAEFQRAFQQLGRSREDARVPGPVRERLRSAAAVERRLVEDFEALEPVEGSEAAVDAFIRAARIQADRLDAAAARPGLTVAEMADTVELPEMRDALAALARQDLVTPPGHQ